MTTTDAPRVAIVVVSFESGEDLLACLHSVARHARLPAETVVVDNASTDGSVDAVRSRLPDIRVIPNSDNVGFARACNQGLRATRAPRVLFLNPDAELTEGCVEALVARLDARPDLGVVAPRLRHPDGTVEVSTGSDLGLLTEWRQRRLVRGVALREPAVVGAVAEQHSMEHEPDWVSGAALLARRQAMESVGGFDERFFLYEEDADLCRRLRQAGWRILFTPAAEVRHRRGASMLRTPLRARVEYHRSHLRYYRAHNDPLARAALRLLLLGRGLGGLAGAALRGDPSAAAVSRAVLRLALRGA